MATLVIFTNNASFTLFLSIQIGSYYSNFKDGEIQANKHLMHFKFFIQAETSEGFETHFLVPFARIPLRLTPMNLALKYKS